MFKVLDFTKDDVIAIKATGEIKKNDYDVLEPLLEKTEKEYQGLNLYIFVDEIDGITPEALLKDIITYFRHIKNMQKIAVVGEKQAEKSLTKIADPFIRADIKFFPRKEQDIARDWIKN